MVNRSVKNSLRNSKPNKPNDTKNWKIREDSEAIW